MKEDGMKPDYKNWFPKGMVIGFEIGVIVCAVLAYIFCGIAAGVGTAARGTAVCITCGADTPRT